MLCNFFILCLFIFFNYVYGIDDKKIIRSSKLESEILKNGNSNKSEKKEKQLSLLNESFILLKNKKSSDGSDVPGSRLISYKKPTAQSTVLAHKHITAVSRLAVDGNKNADFMRGSCTHTVVNGKYPWWEVNLLNFYAIDRVEITNRRDCCAERLHSINVAVMNTTYTDPTKIPIENRCGDEIKGPGKPGELIQVNCENKVGIYVGIWINSNKATLTLCEVEVFGRDLCTAGIHQCDKNTSKCLFDEEDAYTCECLPGFKKTSNNGKEECIPVNQERKKDITSNTTIITDNHNSNVTNNNTNVTNNNANVTNNNENVANNNVTSLLNKTSNVSFSIRNTFWFSFVLSSIFSNFLLLLF